MSVLARRRREQDDAGRRALLGTRDSVIAAVTGRMPQAGSLAIEEAVDGALEQLLGQRAERCELGYARRWWIAWAQRRLVDKHRTAAHMHRDPVPVDEHPHVLSQHTSEDPFAQLDEELVTARLAELVASLAGPQREWAETLFAQLQRAAAADQRGDDPPVALPLHEVLGWSAAKEKKTAQRARETMTAFVNERSAGTICSRRQAVLDVYITATGDVGATQSAGADRREFQAVALHLAGCLECQIAWAQRRSSLLGRFGAFVLGPLDALAAGAHALADKLAGVWTGTQQLTLSLLQRLGIGSGAAAGGAITLTGKTAAVCAGLVCAATAGGELTGVLPPILPNSAQHKRVDATSKPAPPALPARSSSGPVAVTPPPPPARAASSAKTHHSSATRTATTAQRASSAPTSSTSLPRVTPGDLPLASNTASPTPTKPSPPPAAVPPPASTPNCFPGDLGC